jgi:hypothetical protein
MRISHHSSQLLAALLVALAIGPGVFPFPVRAAAAADAPPEFVLLPVDQPDPYFAPTIEPGESSSLTVALGNAGEAPVEAVTFVADAYTLINGGFGVKGDDQPKTGPTTWIDYPSETLELAPEKSIERSFTVAVPADTSPGQYIAGLVLQTAEPIAVGDSAVFRQSILKSIAIFITVPGPVTPALAIGQATLDQKASAARLLIEVSNPGNVLLKPTGTVTMTNEAGEQVLTAPVAMGSVYAGMDTLLEISFPTALPPGTYTVTVHLEDDQTGATADATALTVTAGDPNAVTTAPPVVVEAVDLTESRDAATNQLQFVNVGVRLANSGDPILSARVTLHVTLNDSLVEDFPLASSLALPLGTTEVQQRYLPIGGWQAGTYAFSVTVEAVDARSGQTSVLATAEAPATVTAP